MEMRERKTVIALLISYCVLGNCYYDETEGCTGRRK